jgi:ATP-dependent DNA helicase RecG
MNEHQTIEWKEVWRDEYLRWICAFANADGGTLVIGRNDRGDAVGVDDARKLLEEIPNKVRDLLGIVVAVHLRKERRELIEIVVEPSPTPISYRGEYHVRSGSTKQELRGPALSAFLLRRLGRHWDGAPVPGAAVSDLDVEALRTFRARAARSDRMEEGALPDTDAELLERLHLTEGAFLKRAALLLFHRDPERFVTGAFLKIGFFEGPEILFHDRVEGGLFRQVSMALEILNAKYLRSRISYAGIQRIETPPVPDAALREAVLNAVIHKDYGAGSPVQIRVYEDRLRVWNAGQLPPTWTADTLIQKHASFPPNPDIANAFFRLGMIETWGRGIEKILSACRAAGLTEPVLEADGVGICVEFQFPALRPESQPEWEPESQPESLSLRVLQVLEKGALRKAAISAALGQKKVSGPLNQTIRQLLAEECIEYTIPSKPGSRLQEYRLTPKGRERRARRRQG